jgi:hypothetical protein
MVAIPVVLNYIGTLFIGTQESMAMIFGFIVIVAAIIVSILMSIAVLRSVIMVSSDSNARISVIGQYQEALPYFWSFLLVSIISGLILLGSFALFIIPGIIVGVYVAFNLNALIVDGKKGFSAILESYSLVRGRWMDVFGRLLMLALVNFGVYIVVVILNVGFSYISGVNIDALHAHQQIPLGLSLVGFVINLAVQAFVAPFSIIYSYKLYQSLKSSRQADVSTVVFKRWSIAFMIIGPVMVIFFVVASAAFVAFEISRTQSQLHMQLSDPQFQARLEKALQEQASQKAAQAASSSVSH